MRLGCRRQLGHALEMTVRPTVTPDRKSVLVMLDAQLRELADDQAPLFPVTTFVTPVFEGGSQGPPVPFTHASRASGTWRPAASPRSWTTASTSRNILRIPGWQADSPPPSVFVGSAPPRRSLPSST